MRKDLSRSNITCEADPLYDQCRRLLDSVHLTGPKWALHEWGIPLQYLAWYNLAQWLSAIHKGAILAADLQYRGHHKYRTASHENLPKDLYMALPCQENTMNNMSKLVEVSQTWSKGDQFPDHLRPTSKTSYDGLDPRIIPSSDIGL